MVAELLLNWLMIHHVKILGTKEYAKNYLLKNKFCLKMTANLSGKIF